MSPTIYRELSGTLGSSFPTSPFPASDRHLIYEYATYQELALLRTTHLIPLSNTSAAMDPLMIPQVAESARQTRARQGNAWEDRFSS